jgi:GDP/UDP-N,N'-diacetylbacillosamine 2-epimerase (hydrolysing)
MKVAVLTSSRADYGIYFPLLQRLKDDVYFDMEIIAFGTHLSKQYGYTLDQIESDGFEVAHKIETLAVGDSALDISQSVGHTIELFAKFWSEHTFDLIFALGDRYEMFAAVCAGLPFNIKVAHISGGETTLGAIDNVYRHSLSLMATYHFASTDSYKNRIIDIIGSSKNVYNVGALNIENFINQTYLSIEAFKEKFAIDLSIPSILITFHPETVAFERNIQYANELIHALEQCDNYQLIITMPNSDTMGVKIREILNRFIESHSNAIGVESFGMLGYISCMKHCSFMLGNTSSGFVEAAFFPKYVINIGDRQKGRLLTPNIINTPVESKAILAAIEKVAHAKALDKIDVYGKGNTAELICSILKNIKL